MPTKTTRRKPAAPKKPRAGTGKARRARATATAPKRRGRPAGVELSAEHKAAMTNGRLEANAIKRFLVIAGESSGARGKAASPETIRTRLERCAAKAARTTNELRKLQLTAERMELEKALARAERRKGSATYTNARAAFIANAKSYSERHSIPRAAWRAMGVDVETLREAGL